jgi:hypothetical protein
MAEKRIGGQEYRVEPLLATKAWALRLRVAKLIDRGTIEELTAVFKQADTDGRKLKDIGLEIVGIIAELLAKHDPEQIVGLLKDLCEIAQVRLDSGYSRVIFDEEFTGKGAEALELAAFVIAEQFSELFSDALVSGIQKAAARAPSRKQRLDA